MPTILFHPLDKGLRPSGIYDSFNVYLLSIHSRLDTE